MVKITLFQHTPCRYLPVSLIDRHPIWPPQPVHSHRLVWAIARQIFSTSTSNGPKMFDLCPDGSPDIQRGSGKTHIHIIGGTLIKTLREGFWEGNFFPTRIDRQTTPAEYILEQEKTYQTILNSTQKTRQNLFTKSSEDQKDDFHFFWLLLIIWLVW